MLEINLYSGGCKGPSLSPIPILGPFSGKSVSLRNKKKDNKNMQLRRGIFILFISMSFTNITQSY